MTVPAAPPLAIRFSCGPRSAVIRLHPEGAEEVDGAAWSLGVTLPRGQSNWWDVRLQLPADRRPDRLAFGCRRSGGFSGLVDFSLRCRIDLDGPSWAPSTPSILLSIERSRLMIGPAFAAGDQALDLVMAMPWVMFVRWIADERSLFGDQVVDQLIIDGSIAALSTIDGVLGLAEVGADARGVDAVVAWNRMWEIAEVRQAVARILKARAR